MLLTTSLRDVDKLIYKGRVIPLNLYFDVVLRALELAEDEVFSKLEKVYIWRDMFIADKEQLEGFDTEDLVIIVDMIFKKLLGNNNNGDSSEKLFCFRQDAEYIYASFMSDYRIDLIDMQGKLHWFKFIALLKGLTESSKFAEVMSIRTMPVPKRNKYNEEERKRIIRLKKIHALKDTGTRNKGDELLSKFDMYAEMAIKSHSNKQ